MDLNTDLNCGDKIKCIDNNDSRYSIIIGREYTFDAYGMDPQNKPFLRLKEVSGGWYPHRFEFVRRVGELPPITPIKKEIDYLQITREVCRG